MPSEAPVLPTQTEKPHHYSYLKEFRTQQCPLFLQHKCTQHRPFTCFHWHFMNQRRRRPVRKRDGTFSYNPDVYCTKFDETTGICEDGDDCPFLHRTAGDTERRYHLRYYKTGTCVHETDARGHCVKNGPHCAFAHGALDMRPPVYDVREIQSLDSPDKTNGLHGLSCTPSSLEKERILNEDPKWNDTNYVLANYKTEPCKRPPRLCRQGYACPQYHNSRDRRRSPRKQKYRSTPCPNVKHGDDWGDPAQCDSGDNCPYCHTRTEQQFHPEIYKSTKCNDMVQTSYCPRGPFCAFAHVEHEMTTTRELSSSMDNSLAAFLTNALPMSDENGSVGALDQHLEKKDNHQTNGGSSSAAVTGAIDIPLGDVAMGLPRPIGKERSNSTSSNISSDLMHCGKAPGFEREDLQVKLRNQLQSIENDHSLDFTEKAKRKQNLLLLHNLTNSVGSSITCSIGSLASTLSSTMSPHAQSFYPPGDTVESVIGNALDEDLNLGELTLSALDKEFSRDNDNDTNSVSSTLSAGFPSNYLNATSVPISIPSSSSVPPRGSIGSLSCLSQSPVSSSPVGILPVASSRILQQQQKQEQQIEQAAAAFLSQPNPGKYAVPAEFNSMSPRNNGLPQSPMFSSSLQNSGGFSFDSHKDDMATRAKLAQWEEIVAQSRSACEAWRKEAEEAARKFKLVDGEKQAAAKQRDEAMIQISKIKMELEQLRSGPFLHGLQRVNELDSLPLAQLKLLQHQLRIDLETVEKVVYRHAAMKCVICQERNRSVAVMPCNHYVLCDSCAAKQTDCPYCHSRITQRSSIVLPL